MNRAPYTGLDVIETLPSCASTICLTMYGPSPPRTQRVLLPACAHHRLEQGGLLAALPMGLQLQRKNVLSLVCDTRFYYAGDYSPRSAQTLGLEDFLAKPLTDLSQPRPAPIHACATKPGRPVFGRRSGSLGRLALPSASFRALIVAISKVVRVSFWMVRRTTDP